MLMGVDAAKVSLFNNEIINYLFTNKINIIRY